MTAARRTLCSLAAGVAVALSLPPWGWWPLAFAGIAAFELALGAAPSARSRVGLGFAFAFAWMSIGMAWMWYLTAPGYLVASTIFALAHAGAALAAPQGRWRVVGRPLAHTFVETVRFSWPFGGVPLASLGISQAASPLAGIARIGGVILLTWAVLQVGFALGTLVRRAGRGEVRLDEVRLDGAALACIAAVLLIASVAPRGSGTGVFLDIVAVQGGGEQGTRADDVRSEIVTARHVEATRSIEPDDELDFVLWPENVVDVVDFEASDTLEVIAAEAARLGVPIAVGVTEDVPGEARRFTNAQVIVTPEGTVTSRYDKVRRVPFGEYVPLRGLLEALGTPVDQVPNDAVAGTDPALLDLPDGTRVAVVISWEVFFGGRVREGVREGAGVVLNPTNGASYTLTILQTQQIASSRLRAIETGRWVVQAAPTGFSAFVTPSGDVIDRTGVSERALVRHRVELRDGETWYVRLGDRPIIAVLAAAFAATWFAATRRSLAGGGQPDDSPVDDHGDRAVVHQ